MPVVFDVICWSCGLIYPGPDVARADAATCPHCGARWVDSRRLSGAERDAYIERSTAFRDAQWDARCLDAQRHTGRDVSGYLRRHGMPWRLNPDGTCTQCPEGTLARMPGGLWVHVSGTTWRPGVGDELDGLPKTPRFEGLPPESPR